MDTSTIQVNQIKPEVGIKVGLESAPIKVVEFINLRCPYCRQWFEESQETFQTYVAKGQVQRIIKLYDKSKPGLAKGNVMHQYVPKTSDPLAAIASIYTSQETWGALDSPTELAEFAEQNLNLRLERDQQTTDDIIAEATAAGVVFVPTMIVNNHIFDQKISQVDFKQLLDSLL